jgi:sigma-B regulation protein RsbU (phosphoserine phosphatase)
VPARGVGGDYYDFFDLGKGRIGIALADVAGKGIAAALIMSVVQASLRSLTSGSERSLANLTSQMNKLLLRSTGNSSYATFFYSEYDEATRKLRYVNAGHNPPMLLRARARDAGSARLTQSAGVTSSGVATAGAATAEAVKIEELTTGGLVIGLFAVARYEEGEVELRPGDLLIAYTDGVSEALNPVGEEFGEDRIRAALETYVHLPVAEMSERLMNDLKTWIAEAPQYDDMTFILMKMA